MIQRFLSRLARDQRSAVAIIFAVSLVPLVSLVGIAIDFTLFSQARTQALFAAQAAATHAVRVAASTYTLDEQNGLTTAQADAHALQAGEVAGALWFEAELGSLNRASLTTETAGSCNACVLVTDSSNGSGNAPNFTATVNVAGDYPPVFKTFFKTNSDWIFKNTASATTTFQYAQILLLLDTSNSMLIGADSSDITTLEGYSVCPPQGAIASNYGMNDLHIVNPNLIYSSPFDFTPIDGDYIDFSPAAGTVQNYNYAAATGVELANSITPGGSPGYKLDGPCNAGYGAGSGIYPSPTGYNGPITAFAPCALACHTTNATFTYSDGDKEDADLYGLARHLRKKFNTKLRLDVVFTAAEDVIKDMQTSEAVANQLSIGIYQFNADVAPIFPIPGTTAGDALPEASSDLASALKAVQNDDYQLNPGETAVPVLTNGTYNFANNTETDSGNTNLPLVMNNLVTGKLPTDSNASALTASGDGSTALKPVKFLILVTDGLEDDSSDNGGSAARTFGDMTSLSDNQAVSNAGISPGTCTALKKLGYTIYVLYVDYLPVAHTTYYIAALGSLPNANTQNDFPAAHTAQQESDTSGLTTNAQKENVPTYAALKACASNSDDFDEASDSNSIKAQLLVLLKKALASTIRLTN